VEGGTRGEKGRGSDLGQRREEGRAEEDRGGKGKEGGGRGERRAKGVVRKKHRMLREGLESREARRCSWLLLLEPPHCPGLDCRCHCTREERRRSR
jgi:hypothetical protein